MSEQPNRAVVNKYEGYGLLAGAGIGLLLGVMYSGPHFRDWPASMSFLVVLCTGAVGAAIGYFAVWIAVGSTGRGFGADGGISDSGYGSSGHSDAGDSGSGGGGDGGNGGGGSDG